MLRKISGVLLLAVVSFSFACSSGSSSGDGSGSGSTTQATFKCEVSAAASGDLCQVNFFCDGGDGPAAYCNSKGECACGAAADNPKEFTSEGICELDMNERADVANRECGFGM